MCFMWGGIELNRSTIQNWQTNWQNWNKRNLINVWREQRRHHYILLGQWRVVSSLPSSCLSIGAAEKSADWFVWWTRVAKTPAQTIEEDEEEAELRELQAQLAM